MKIRCFLILMLFIVPSVKSQDIDRGAKEAVAALEAYAVYKMAKYEQAFFLFMQLAEKNNPQGMINVANMLTAGLGVNKDEQGGFRWYKKAAEGGSASAMFYVGEAYQLGRGVESNLLKAKVWYQRAAKSGAVDGEYALGKLWLEEGEYEKGLTLIRSASKKNSIAAKQYLSGLEIAQSQEYQPNPSSISLAQQGAIFSAYQAIDRAAKNRNPAGIVYYLTHTADIRVKLPKSPDWITINKQGLQKLWKETFETAIKYTYSRGQLSMEKVEGAIAITSIITEEIYTKNERGEEQVRKLNLQERSVVKIKNDTLHIESLTMEIHTM